MNKTTMVLLFLSASYVIFNLFTLQEGKDAWAPYIYSGFRESLTPFGAFVPTLLIVCLTLIYQIICTIGMIFVGIGILWMNIFKRKDTDEEI